jgi:hypothetical protein
MFMPDIIAACYILHNILLGQHQEDVARLLKILRDKGLDGDRDHDGEADEDPGFVVDLGDACRGSTEELRNRLVVFVASARKGPRP